MFPFDDVIMITVATQNNVMEHNGRHFVYDIYKCISFNENVWIAIKISLQNVGKAQLSIHPSPKVMADFFQTQKLTWCPHPICTNFGECIKCMQVVIYCAQWTRVTLYTAGHLHTAVPHCSHSRAPIVHTAVPPENNEHGCVCLRCRAVCKLPGCVEGHPWWIDLLH